MFLLHGLVLRVSLKGFGSDVERLRGSLASQLLQGFRIPDRGFRVCSSGFRAGFGCPVVG